MCTSPATAPSESETSLSALRTSSSISSARLRSIMPSSVSVTRREPRVTRISSRLPSSSSSAFSCVESVGCERCSDSAAADMLCSRATARKYCSTLSSMSSPPRPVYQAEA